MTLPMQRKEAQLAPSRSSWRPPAKPYVLPKVETGTYKDLKQRLFWIGVMSVLAAGVVTVVLVLTGPITPSIAIAAALGTLFSFALAGGLMTALFFSDRSGLDEATAVIVAETESHQYRNDDLKSSKLEN